jgi:4-hydroxybenzoate polyprenyltransferase
MGNRSLVRRSLAVARLTRPARTPMVAMITGAVAFTAGAGSSRSLWMAFATWFLAVGGFSLDFVADRDL